MDKAFEFANEIRNREMKSGTEIFQYLSQPEVIQNPFPVYQALQEKDYLLRIDYPEIFSKEAFFVFGYEEANSILRSKKFGKSDEVADWYDSPEHRKMIANNPFFQMSRHWMLLRDPPDHTRLRKLVSKVFTPGRVRNMKDRIDQLVIDLLHKIKEGGKKFDFIASFAYPLPVAIISAMLGVPPEDDQKIRSWTVDIAKALGFTATDADMIKINKTTKELIEYFRVLANERRQSPQDDLISSLIEAEEGGDQLSEDELLASCILLIVAGHETTQSLIGNGMFALFNHQNQLDMIKSDPGLISNAVEEMLRYDSPVQSTSRRNQEAVSLKHHDIPQGKPFNIFIQAANRDPRIMSNPNEFDITREKIKHLAFGAGIHFCIGAPLARAEASTAFKLLFEEMPEITLKQPPVYKNNLVLRGLRELLVEY